MPRPLSALLLLSLLATAAVAQPSAHSTDYVRLVGGRELSGNVRVVATGEEPYLVVGEGQRYTLGEVTAFEVDGVRFVNHFVVAPHTDPADIDRLVLRQVEEGRLSLYAAPDWRDRAMWREDPDRAVFSFFTLDGGQLQYATSDNLRPILSENEASARLIDASDTWRRAQIALSLTGGAVFLYGVYRTFSGAATPATISSPSTYDIELNLYQPIGLALVLSGVLAGRQKKRTWRRAIDVFNETAAR